jgi:hypothetical protein
VGLGLAEVLMFVKHILIVACSDESIVQAMHSYDNGN